MKHLIISFENYTTIRLQTRPTGDVEVVKTTPNINREGKSAGGGHDSTIGVIPKSQRCAVAEFLTQA